jgi:flagellar L-ring protein precursor FlgH
MKVVILVVLMGVAVAGCFPFEQSRIKEEPFVLDNIHRYSNQSGADQRSGSLWHTGNNGNLYFGDHRARAIGDLVTIKIVEISQASEKATTDTGRTSDIEAGIPNFFAYPGANPSANINPAQLIRANTRNTFAGSGETTRSGTVTATVSAKVVEVFPNGNLAVEGKREIHVNNEKKEILLQGIVRPKDIGSDNSVLSTQVADAKIMLTGIGVVGEKQRPGWLTRIFDGIWPF